MKKIKNLNLGATLEVVVTLTLAVAALIMLLLCAGCAGFSTDQKDLTYDEKGNLTREITTRATARTFVAAKSALANWKASQTDKTQGASVGSLSQESNSAETVKAITELLKAAKPAP
jgi:hypothetical protein